MYNCFKNTNVKSLVVVTIFLTFSFGTKAAFNLGKNDVGLVIILLFSGSIFLLFNFSMLGVLNNQSLDLLASNFEEKCKLEMIIQNIEESIITLSDDRVQMVNEPFLNIF